MGEEIEHTRDAIAKEQAAKAAEQAARRNARAELFTRLVISNSFTIQMDMVSRKADGRFEVDVFQGYQRNAGYRLVYNAGASPYITGSSSSKTAIATASCSRATNPAA
ncbi:MAG: hypothetical protein QGI52_09175 [Alphaproteobacteria bacterium]|nr:hypothetical protein [Alphaproteobacteria bacterium]